MRMVIGIGTTSIKKREEVVIDMISDVKNKKRYNTYCDQNEIKVSIDDDNYNENIFHIYFQELDSAIALKGALNNVTDEMNDLHEDNEGLWRIVENQSVIINELLEALYQHTSKEYNTITLTVEDLKTLDKALSYYTHTRIEED